MIGPKKKTAVQAVSIDDLVAIRSRLDNARGRRSAIEAAPTDADELRRRIERIVDVSMGQAKADLALSNLADERLPAGGLNVEMPSHPAGVIGGPTGFAAALPLPYGFGRAFQSAGLGVFAMLIGRDAVVERLFSEAAKFAENGLSAADRTTRLAAAEREIHDLEIVEEEVGRALDAIGFQPERRRDARPEIVLAIDLNKVEAPHALA